MDKKFPRTSRSVLFQLPLISRLISRTTLKHHFQAVGTGPTNIVRRYQARLSPAGDWCQGATEICPLQIYLAIYTIDPKDFNIVVLVRFVDGSKFLLRGPPIWAGEISQATESRRLDALPPRFRNDRLHDCWILEAETKGVAGFPPNPHSSRA